MNNTIDPKDSISLLLANHQHIHENIKFADQKAMVFVAINTGLLGVIYPLINSKDPVTLYAGFVICSLLAAGIGYGIWVIKPRHRANDRRGPGVADPHRIPQFTLYEYLSRVGTISNADLLDEVRTLTYDRAFVHDLKYVYLRRSILLSAAGSFGALLLAGWVKAWA